MLNSGGGSTCSLSLNLLSRPSIVPPIHCSLASTNQFERQLFSHNDRIRRRVCWAGQKTSKCCRATTFQHHCLAQNPWRQTNPFSQCKWPRPLCLLASPPYPPPRAIHLPPLPPRPPPNLSLSSSSLLSASSLICLISSSTSAGSLST